MITPDITAPNDANHGHAPQGGNVNLGAAHQAYKQTDERDDGQRFRTALTG